MEMVAAVVRRRGRPPVGDAPASAVIKVRLTSAQKSALTRVARDNHQTLTAFVRAAVNEAVDECCERGPVFTA